MKFKVIGEEYRTKTGQVYVRDGRTHVASAPGETFASDYKKTERSITVEAETEMRVVIAPHTDYALALEFGTSSNAPRPMWVPVAEEMRKTAPRIIATEIRSTVK